MQITTLVLVVIVVIASAFLYVMGRRSERLKWEESENQKDADIRKDKAKAKKDRANPPDASDIADGL